MCDVVLFSNSQRQRRDVVTGGNVLFPTALPCLVVCMSVRQETQQPELSPAQLQQTREGGL